MRIASAGTRLIRRLLDLSLLVLIVAVLGAVVLARVVPWVTGGTTLVVGSGSMVPAIPVGAAVVSMPVDPERLQVGDIVSLRVGPQQAIFTHRIVRFADLPAGRHLETKGDANPIVDPSLVPVSAVIGRTDAFVPVAGYLITMLSRPEGIVFVLGIAGLLLAATWLVETIELDQRAARRRALAQRRPAPRLESAPGGPLVGPPLPAFLDSTPSSRTDAPFVRPWAEPTIDVAERARDERVDGEPIARRLPAARAWADPGRHGPPGAGRRRSALPAIPFLPEDATLGDRIASIRASRGRSVRRAPMRRPATG